MRQTLQIPSLPITQLVPTWTRAWANDMLSNDSNTWLSNNKLISFVINYLLSIIVKTKVTVFDSQLLLPSMSLLSSWLLKKYQASPYSTVDSLYIWFVLYVSVDLILWTFTQLLVCLIFDNLLVVPLLHSFIHTVCSILYFRLFCFWV